MGCGEKSGRGRTTKKRIKRIIESPIRKFGDFVTERKIIEVILMQCGFSKDNLDDMIEEEVLEYFTIYGLMREIQQEKMSG